MESGGKKDKRQLLMNSPDASSIYLVVEASCAGDDLLHASRCPDLLLLRPVILKPCCSTCKRHTRGPDTITHMLCLFYIFIISKTKR